METPQVRPGKISPREAMHRVVAYFYNSAQANSVIQLLAGLGVPSDRLGITPPEQIEGKQGMVLSIACPTDSLRAQVEDICKKQGADVHHQRA
jgi:hypothetical protein